MQPGDGDRSTLRHGTTVALARGFSGGADHGTDRSPRVPLRTGNRDRICNSAFGLGPRLERLSNRAQCGGVADVGRFGVMRLEAGGELVGLVEDLFHGARHAFHLRYLGRAGIACTMTGPSLAVTTPISKRLPA